MYLRKGDNVIMIAGKDKGTKGKVERVLRERGQVVVEGVNNKKHHQRPARGGENQKGQIIEVPAPVSASNVQLVDPKTGERTRIRNKVKDDGSKVRVAVKSGQEV
jgi:large subunit ribosomal protein L24